MTKAKNWKLQSAKTAVDRNYTVTIQGGCSHPYMFAMRLTDAIRTNDYTFTLTTSLIYFDNNACELSAEANEQLQQLAKQLKANPEKNILLIGSANTMGHT